MFFKKNGRVPANLGAAFRDFANLHDGKLDDGQKQLRAEVCFQDLQIGEFRVLCKRRQIWGHWLYISAMHLEDGGSVSHLLIEAK